MRTVAGSKSTKSAKRSRPAAVVLPPTPRFQTRKRPGATSSRCRATWLVQRSPSAKAFPAVIESPKQMMFCLGVVAARFLLVVFIDRRVAPFEADRSGQNQERNEEPRLILEAADRALGSHAPLPLHVGPRKKLGYPFAVEQAFHCTMHTEAKKNNRSAPHVIPAVPGDFLAIAALDRDAWGDNPHSKFIPDGEHVWRIWCEHALTFAAWCGEREMAGAVVAFPCLDGCFCLHKVMVAKPHRGQGIGSLLFEELFETLDHRGAECFLTVDPANTRAVRLYRKWGFSRECFVSGFYRQEEDRLVLTRPRQRSNT